MPFLSTYIDVRTLIFFPPAESWLVNSNFPRASRMQGSTWTEKVVGERHILAVSVIFLLPSSLAATFQCCVFFFCQWCLDLFIEALAATLFGFEFGGLENVTWTGPWLGEFNTPPWDKMWPRLTGLPYLADWATHPDWLPHLSWKHDQIK